MSSVSEEYLNSKSILSAMREISSETLEKALRAQEKREGERISSQEALKRGLDRISYGETDLIGVSEAYYDLYPIFKNSISPIKTGVPLPADIAARLYESEMKELKANGRKLSLETIGIGKNFKTQALFDAYAKAYRIANRTLSYGEIAKLNYRAKDEITENVARTAFEKALNGEHLSRKSVEKLTRDAAKEYLPNAREITNDTKEKTVKAESKQIREAAPKTKTPAQKLHDAIPQDKTVIEELEEQGVIESVENIRKPVEKEDIPEPTIVNNVIIENLDKDDQQILDDLKKDLDNMVAEDVGEDIEPETEPEIPENNGHQEKIDTIDPQKIVNNSISEPIIEEKSEKSSTDDIVNEDLHNASIMSQEELAELLREQIRGFEGCSEETKITWAENKGNTNLVNQLIQQSVNNIPSFANNNEQCDVLPVMSNGNEKIVGFKVVGRNSEASYGEYMIPDSDREQIENIVGKYDVTEINENRLNSPLVNTEITQMNPTPAERIDTKAKDAVKGIYADSGKGMIVDMQEKMRNQPQKQNAI